jgi:hypothetical protein
MQVLNPAGLAVNQPTVHGASLSSTQSGGNTGAGGGVSETFSALDASPTAGRPSWVQAGAQHAEAGFQDPSLGWVGVRADLSGGAIHAAIVPGSAEASQTLGGHMAGLNAYLSEQHTSVGSVTLASPQGRDSFSNGDGGMNQGMQQGSGQQAGQGTAAESATVPEGSAPVNAGVASFSGPTQTTGVVLAFEPQAAEGSSISVLA